MLQRDIAIEELKERIRAAKTDLGIKALKHNPDSPATESQIPGIFIHEGEDSIVKPGTQTWSGYPVIRRVEIYFEILTTGGRSQVKEMHRKLRDVLFQAPLTCGVVIREVKAFGPAGNGVPGVLFMQLIISLTYTDQGPTNQV